MNKEKSSEEAILPENLSFEQNLAIIRYCGDSMDKEIQDLKSQVATLEKAYKAALNSAEFSWSVIANVGGGDWSVEPMDWQMAAKSARENYYRALDERPPSLKTDQDKGGEG